MTKKEENLLDNMIGYYENNEEKKSFNYQKENINNLLNNYPKDSKVIYLKKLIRDTISRRMLECSLFGTILISNDYTEEERNLLAHYYIPFKHGDYELERDCMLSLFSEEKIYSHQFMIYALANLNGVAINIDKINEFFKKQKMISLESFKTYKNPSRKHQWKEKDEEIKNDYNNLSSKSATERNSIIGDYAEILIVKYEKMRLQKMGREDLADRIIHVSRYLGDIYGYDILSFDGTKDKEENDTVYLIEVKGYYTGTTDKIYLSENEYCLFSGSSIEDENREYLVYQLDFKKKMLYPILSNDGDGKDVSGNRYILSSNDKKGKTLIKQKTNS